MRSLAETGSRLLEVLVPRDDATAESQEQITLRRATGMTGVGTVELTPIEQGEYRDRCSMEEVRHALWRMKPKKSPGMDGLTGEILRRA